MLAIYCRISREKEDGKDRSIKEQKLRGQEFAKKLGLDFKLYIDEGVSGTWSLEKRPAFFELIQDLTSKKGVITAVYAFDASRLYRSDETRLSFLSAIKKKNIDLYFDNGKFDWSDPYMDFMGKVLSATDVLHVDVTKLKVKSILKRNASEGKAFGITPYGYSIDDKGYFLIDEEEAEIVKRIYELSLTGKGTRTIANMFNDEGIPTRYNTLKEGTITVKNRYTGKKTTRDKSQVKWAQNTIRGIITNPIYKGVRNWGKESFDLPQLQIFDPHYWHQVNDNLAKNSNNKGKSVEHKYMLKGLLECGICGRNYYGRTRANKKDNYYMCSSKRHKHETCTNRSINIGVMESFIWETMFERDTLFRKMLKTFNEGGTEKRRNELSNLVKTHRKKLDGLEQERRRMVRAVIKGTLQEKEVEGERLRITRSENDYRERLKKDGAELYKLENEVRIIEDIVLDFDHGTNSQLFKELDKLFPKGRENWKKGMLQDAENEQKEKLKRIATFNEKKRLLTKYLKRIYIEYDYDSRIYILTVTYNLPLEDETYLIDSNYIAAYSPDKGQMLDWHFDYGRRFTVKKVRETLDLLRNYYS